MIINFLFWLLQFDISLLGYFSHISETVKCHSHAYEIPKPLTEPIGGILDPWEQTSVKS